MSIKLETTCVYGWEAAIRGMRNPKNSWHLSDTKFYYPSCNPYDINMNEYPNEESGGWNGCGGDYLKLGEKDHALMMTLAKAGTTHSKYRRMINVTVDITAPLYWWKEFDTYKIGTVSDSCSTMHKIDAKEFTLDDFSCEHLLDDIPIIEDIENKYFHYFSGDDQQFTASYMTILMITIDALNCARQEYLKTKDKRYWWQMIQLLPSSYNQKRTIQLNYEVLSNIYHTRKDHKLDEWHRFCDWIEHLPYSEIITLQEEA